MKAASDRGPGNLNIKTVARLAGVPVGSLADLTAFSLHPLKPITSGEGGMTTQSALAGYTFGFWALLGAGVLLFLIAPLVQKLMHGVK